MTAPPSHLLVGEAMATEDMLFAGPTVQVVVRPSGTEPKLKCYCEARRPVEEARRNLKASRAAAAQTLEVLWGAIKEILDAN